MITSDDLQRLQLLRGRLFAYIDMNIAADPHHKSYEGTFQITMPNRFEDRWQLHVSCYVVGPGRGQTWEGETFSECLDKAEKEMEEWFSEENRWLAMLEKPE